MMKSKDNTDVEPKQKRSKKVRRVIGIMLAVITVCMLIGSILHATYFENKKQVIEPYGQMIDVYDGQMHVYKMGSGKETIILLPGIGIGLPSADFSPLMRQLSEKYTVVCVEYFGVGFSSQTQRARTTENYVDEIRTALKSSGVEAPYILMAHSVSSVYSEYYASKYPDEVQAIISLDGTSTAYIGADMPSFVKSLLGVAKFQQAIGFTSIVAPIATNKDNLLSIGYTEKEISDLIYYAGFSMNDNTLDQIASTTDYIKDVNKLAYPENVPYFKIISKKTYETKNSQIKITPQKYQEQHLARIGEHAKYEIVEGTHFIYLDNVDRISEITDEFLLDITIGDDRDSFLVGEFKYIGYISDFEKSDGTRITFDSIEWITLEDIDRIDELEIEDFDMPNGYYIYNPEIEKNKYEVNKNTEYRFIDWGNNFASSDDDRFHYSTIDKEEFVEYLNTYTDKAANVPFWITMKDNAVHIIEEQYVP